ncbi:hypothetical protein B0J11DRAFT_10645 [Dendryphion nanum]|uniref:Heterokaryon incompatibility domain-containing protein n=1 Tax=Dendryphion nanum TaxID=256645 RepID=A0A9P9IWI9_9PLEO|nr:hypothetical protein B0J11DRAFT_10645 [Dendryphion nanum]
MHTTISPNNEEWTEEAKNVVRIYSCAHTCISANCAPDSDAPLFSTRTYDLAIKPSFEHTNLFLQLNTQWGGTSAFIANYECRLSTRGWTFQERSLSKRVLHLGRTEAFLECWNSWVSERGEVFFDAEKFVLSLKALSVMWPNASQSEAHDKNKGTQRQLSDILKLWYKTAIEYAHRQLTNASDRVLAFSAITNMYDPFIEPQNFCGRWECDIMNGLLWFDGSHSPQKVWLSHLMWVENHLLDEARGMDKKNFPTQDCKQILYHRHQKPHKYSVNMWTQRIRDIRQHGVGSRQPHQYPL